MSRCQNPNNPKFYRYGARGIIVCERWRLYANFREDMGEKPARKSLDRIDNDGNYEPSNCRWADDLTQQRNRSTNKLTQAKVDALKLRMAAGEPIPALALEHQVSQSLLYDIRAGKKWKAPRPRARSNQGGRPQLATQA